MGGCPGMFLPASQASACEGPLEGPWLHIMFPGLQQPEETSEQQSS